MLANKAYTSAQNRRRQAQSRRAQKDTQYKVAICIESTFYILIAWLGYLLMMYSSTLGFIYLNWNFIQKTESCWGYCDILVKMVEMDPIPLLSSEKSDMSQSRVEILKNNILWVCVFFLQHSGMKSQKFKNLYKNERLERGLYVLCSSVILYLALKN